MKHPLTPILEEVEEVAWYSLPAHVQPRSVIGYVKGTNGDPQAYQGRAENLSKLIKSTATSILNTAIEEVNENETKKCEHGHNSSHYTCEPHDYPHVLQNRYGPDCPTCPGPLKRTAQDTLRAMIKKINE